MAKKVVAAEIEIKTANSISDLKALKKQLKDTAAGSEEFKKLYNQIDDLEDKIKSSKNASSDWIDSLESAGGPLGMLGSALNKAKVATQSFGGALKATGIGLIVGLIGGLVAAFSQTEGSMKKLQPLLIGMQKIFGGILAAVEPLLDTFIDLATQALPYVSQAFTVVYSSVTAVFQSLGKLGSAVVKLIKGDFTGAWADAKESVTGFSKNYDDANTRFISGTKKVTAVEQEELDKRKAAREKAAADAKALAEKNEAARLKEQQRNEDSIKANQDFELKIQQDANAREEEAAAKKKEEREKEEQRNRDSMKANADFEVQLARDLMKVDEDNAEKKKKLIEEETKIRVDSAMAIANATSALGAIVGEQTMAGKALGVASALINTYVGASEVIRAKSVLPEPFGTIQKIASVAAIIATGLKTVRTITAVQVPGGGGGSMPSMPSMSAPLMPQVSTTTLNQAQVNQIGNVAARAFVVESDVTGNQERIQRLNRAARIN